ncbi:MAG: hypothetical protein ACRERD_11555 [Candidatus Binatia bacterium]
MQKIVRKFRSFDEAENAEDAYYGALSGDERLQILLELILPENPYEAIIERSARVHPLAEHEEC